jgi:translation initiation factor IF-1
MGKKNLHGGAGHKKFARKHTSSGSSSNSFIRTSQDPNEIYAIATKMLGNNMFHCHCIDNQVRLCHIRGRFGGRNKRDNVISAGTWILIGLREWENVTTTTSSSKKLQQCDLLEIYSGITKERLKELEDCNWSILNTNDLSKVDTLAIESEDDFKFITDRDEEIIRLNEEMKSNTSKKITMIEENKDEDEDEEIDVDLI